MPMYSTKYMIKRLIRKSVFLIYLFLCIFITLLCFDKLPFGLSLWPESPGKYVKQYTKLFFTSLTPNCDIFSTYKNDPKPYWQFYGYQENNLKLNENTLSSFLSISSKQENEIKNIHELLLNNLFNEEKSPLYSNFRDFIDSNYNDDNSGIVYVSGKEYYWLTILSIKYIRSVLKDDVPIQVFVPVQNKSDHHCNKMQLVYPHVTCSYFTDYLSTWQVNQLSGYQYKSLALLLSKFTNNLYLDSDNFLLVPSKTVFNSPKYRSNGLISWPDFWKRSTNTKYYKNAGLDRLANVLITTPSVESGQILINKKTHLKTLLLSYYYNIYGPSYFYPLFSQGFPGEGDKETFYLSSRATNEGSYLITGHKTKSVGYIDKSDLYVGQGILQVDPENFNKYWFMHANYPKLNIVQMLDDGWFKTQKQLGRSWSVVRNAKKESGNEQDFTRLVGNDFELTIWKSMVEILQKDFKGFRLFEEIGNDELADKVKERVITLRNLI